MLIAGPSNRGNRAGPARGAGPALFLTVLAAMVLAGCYSYRPIIGSDPAPGDDVRLRLADTAAQEVSQRVGAPLRAVEGTVLGVPVDSLTVDVRWGAVYAGTMFDGRRDTLAFARRQILEVDRREFSPGRTTLVAAALVGGGIWLLRAVLRSGGDSGGPGGGDPIPF